jgi:hypothetical protein
MRTQKPKRVAHAPTVFRRRTVATDRSCCGNGLQRYASAHGHATERARSALGRR